MEIKYRDIVLRDMVESDIEDWIRWYTVETEWGDWDAPDEPMRDIDIEEYRKEMEQLVRTPREGFRSFFELATADGHHIGAVCSYAIGSDFQWMSWPDAHELGTFCHTIGVDICDSRFWGRGLGTQAIAAFSKHFLDRGRREICLQTWSGNERMIRAAQRIGFAECNRFVGNRQIRGRTYDSLTVRLDLDRFHEYLEQHS